jgi:hypothetical protein
VLPPDRGAPTWIVTGWIELLLAPAASLEPPAVVATV